MDGGRWRDLRDLLCVLTGVGMLIFGTVVNVTADRQVAAYAAGLALLGVPAYLLNGRHK